MEKEVKNSKKKNVDEKVEEINSGVGRKGCRFVKASKGDFNQDHVGMWNSDNGQSFLNALKEQVPTRSSSHAINNPIEQSPNLTLSFEEIKDTILRKKEPSGWCRPNNIQYVETTP